VISHTYADDGTNNTSGTHTYNATVTVQDDDTGVGTSPFSAKVNNVAPSLDALSNLVVNTGTTFNVTANFTDPGFNTETFTYSIPWGDTTSSSGNVTNVTNGAPGVLTTGSVTGSHAYSTAGKNKVTVTVSDDDGGSDSVTFWVTVDNLTAAAALGGAAT